MPRLQLQKRSRWFWESPEADESTWTWSRRQTKTLRSCTATENADLHLPRWLAAVGREGPAWTPEPTLTFANAEEYGRQIETLRRERTEWFAAKVAALRAAGRLDEADATRLLAPVDITVSHLHRDNDQPPLPPLRNVRISRW